jgi:hypothetical protein
MGGQVRMRETRPEKFPRSSSIEDLPLYQARFIQTEDLSLYRHIQTEDLSLYRHLGEVMGRGEGPVPLSP